MESYIWCWSQTFAPDSPWSWLSYLLRQKNDISQIWLCVYLLINCNQSISVARVFTSRNYLTEWDQKWGPYFSSQDNIPSFSSLKIIGLLETDSLLTIKSFLLSKSSCCSGKSERPLSPYLQIRNPFALAEIMPQSNSYLK